MLFLLELADSWLSSFWIGFLASCAATAVASAFVWFTKRGRRLLVRVLNRVTGGEVEAILEREDAYREFRAKIPQADTVAILSGTARLLEDSEVRSALAKSQQRKKEVRILLPSTNVSSVEYDWMERLDDELQSVDEAFGDGHLKELIEATLHATESTLGPDVVSRFNAPYPGTIVRLDSAVYFAPGTSSRFYRFKADGGLSRSVVRQFEQLWDVHRSYELPRDRHLVETYRNLRDLLGKVKGILAEAVERNGQAHVDNLALDGDVTVPWIRDELENRPWFSKVVYRMLIVDSRFSAVRRATEGSKISWEDACRNYQRIAKIAPGVEARLYSIVPGHHGFLIDGKHLFLSHTQFDEQGRLEGSQFPYWYFYVPEDSTRRDFRHLVDFYRSWFDYLWQRHVPYVPREKRRVVAPQVIGHRGLRAGYDENTIEAIRGAAAAGCRTVEIDVQTTYDGQPVLMHDKTVDRTTDGTGRVARLRLDEVRKLRTERGCRVPTLAEACEAVTELGLTCILEIIDFDGWREIVGEAVRLLPPEQLVLASFSHLVLRQIRDEHPDLRTCAILEAAPADPLQIVRATGCNLVSLGVESYSKLVVRYYRSAGVDVLGWTVNDPETARRLVVEGVTGIITDDPASILGTVGGAPVVGA